MLMLVSYDVATTTPAGAKRLRKIAETCLDFGIRVQHSVFECNVDPAQWEMLRHELLSLYNKEEDSLRFYYLGSNWHRRLEHYGKDVVSDIDAPMIL
jgi:CRISPR-associated protein Cas2